MTTEQKQRGDLTRREAIKTALKAGAYAAPVVLSATVPAAVGASPPPGPSIVCGNAGLSFFQDFLLLNVFAGAAFDLFVQPNTAPTPFLVGTFNADAEGVLPRTISLPLAGGPTIPFGTTSVTTSFNVAGTGITAGTFTSLIAGTLACTAAGQVLPVASLTPQMFAKIVQEQTACPAGNPTVWQELVDVNIVNATPNASYDVYIRPNNIVGGGFMLAGTVTTNGQGNGGAIPAVMVMTTGGAPTGVTVNVVPSGMPPTQAGALTFAAAPTGNQMTSSLFTVSCTGTITSQTVSKPLLVGVH